METLFGPLWIPCLVCFLIGMVLLITELCLPGFGIAGCSGFLCFFAVIVMQYMTNTPLKATLVSFASVAVMAVLAALFIRSINKGMLFRSPIVLKENITAESSALDASARGELIGKTGVVETTLRPAGTVLIDGKRYYAKTTASFLEKGTSVRVTAVDGLDIVVE